MGISDLLGKTILEIINDENDRLLFITQDENYVMYHAQDCCESVYLEDINGDLNDLLDSPILQAEESSSTEHIEGQVLSGWGNDSFTWTFYKLATIKGYVTLRWFGSSNGYYSESVDFKQSDIIEFRNIVCNKYTDVSNQNKLAIEEFKFVGSLLDTDDRLNILLANSIIKKKLNE